MTYTFTDFDTDFDVTTNEELFDFELETDLDEALLNGEEELHTFFYNF